LESECIFDSGYISSYADLCTRYGPVGTRFSLILGTRIGSLKRLKKPW